MGDPEKTATDTAGAAATATDDRFVIEFPKEIAPGAPEPAADAAKPKPETAEPEKAGGGKTVPKAALDAERSKRKKYAGLYETVEAQRREAEAEAARLRRELAAKDAEKKSDVDYGALETNQAFEKFGELTRAQLASVQQWVDRELTMTRVALSEEVARDHFKDYDRVLTESGVLAAITINPATGQAPDPFLARQVYGHPNPANFAYHYAKEKLGEVEEGAAEERGRAEGRREVAERIAAAAERPRGIASLTASSAGASGGYTFQDIDRMTDDQKAHIKKAYPDLWQRYLMEVPPPPRVGR